MLIKLSLYCSVNLWLYLFHLSYSPYSDTGSRNTNIHQECLNCSQTTHKSANPDVLIHVDGILSAPAVKKRSMEGGIIRSEMRLAEFVRRQGMVNNKKTGQELLLEG